MTDDEAIALAEQIERAVPPAEGSIQCWDGKPNWLFIRGTAAGLRRLAAAILRSSANEVAWPAEQVNGHAGAEHQTRNHHAVALLVHPASRLHLMGVAAFRELPDNRAQAKSALHRLGCLGLVAAAVVVGVAAVLGFRDIVVWLAG